MTIHRTILAATFALAFTGAAHAGDFPPLEAKSIDLGAVSGIAYYIVERDGFRVVAILAQGETATLDPHFAQGRRQSTLDARD
jgi:hypothetical protein